jgi:hypothetical protein
MDVQGQCVLGKLKNQKYVQWQFYKGRLKTTVMYNLRNNLAKYPNWQQLYRFLKTFEKTSSISYL